MATILAITPGICLFNICYVFMHLPKQEQRIVNFLFTFLQNARKRPMITSDQNRLDTNTFPIIFLIILMINRFEKYIDQATCVFIKAINLTETTGLLISAKDGCVI